jgi:antitoxin (DNA-binding transcriptional repressor) of toxin-antitoxin stability system
MTRLCATQVAREFSAVVNRISTGEKIEVVRNGAPVVEMRPATSSRLVSAARWDELMRSIPSPDRDFGGDVESACAGLSHTGVATARRGNRRP